MTRDNTIMTLNISKRWLLSIAMTTSLFSGSAFSQGLGDIKELCGDLTPANKAMAAQAGYDVDQLCSEIPTMAAAKAAVPEEPKVARETVSSTQTVALDGDGDGDGDGAKTTGQSMSE